MWQNFFHRQQRIAEGITEFLGNLLKVGDTVTLTVRRGNSTHEVAVTLQPGA